MNVLNKGATSKRMAGKGGVVYWRCAVPGCRSISSVKRHRFPNNVERSEKWVKAINNPNLHGLTCDELRKYKVCQLHFSKSSYNGTLVRQTLKEDAVPELMLNISSSAALTNMRVEDEKTHGDCSFEIPMLLPSSDNIQIIPCKSTETPDEGIEHNAIAVHTVPDEGIEHNTIAVHTVPDEGIEHNTIAVHTVPDSASIVQSTQSSDSASKEAIQSTPKTCKRRVLLGSITRKSKLTPVARRLHRIASTLLKKQSKHMHTMSTLKERLESAEKYMGTVQMKKLKGLSKIQLSFLEMQIRNVHKRVNGRRFTLDDKVLALALLKQSPQCYRLLSKIFILPTPRSLQTFLHKIPLKAGVNQLIFDHLKKQGSNMSEKEKVCFLLWDEVSLQSQLSYSQREDKIVGFEDWGNGRTNKFADHALVFMLRGIHTNWKIPLSYNFCKAATSAIQLMRCIKELVRAITKCEFKLVATVCDQGQTNSSCISNLLKETKAICLKENKFFSGRIELSRQVIIPLFDPPHLIKGMRNNLLTKDIEVIFQHGKTSTSKNQVAVTQFLLTPEFLKEIDEKTENVREIDPKRRYFASWDMIELAYDIDTNSINNIKKQMPKLHDGHVRKHKIRKMKVNLAVQTLSRTVSSFIRHLTCIKGAVQTVAGMQSMPITEGVTTSEVIKFFNDAFDSVNGRKQDQTSTKNALRNEVTSSSCHSTFWKEASRCMANNIQFVDKKTKKPRSVPSLRNFSFTLMGFQRLWRTLQQMEFKRFSPRFINQDPLENFFGMIRSHGGRNNNPTSQHFEISFKSLLINNLTAAKTVKGNCEEDEAEALFSLHNFAMMAQNSENICGFTEAEEHSNQYIISHDDSTATGTCMDTAAILLKLCTDIRFKCCCTCVSDMCNFNNFDALCKEAHDNLEANIANYCFKKNVLKNLMLPLSVILDFSFITCTEHFQPLCEAISKSIALEYIMCWGQNINRMLRGQNSGSRAGAMLAKQAVTQYSRNCRKKK